MRLTIAQRRPCFTRQPSVSYHDPSMKIRLAILMAWFSLAAPAAEPALDFVHISDAHLADLADVRPELAKMRMHPGAGGDALRAVLARLATPPSPAFVMLTGDILDAWCFDGPSGSPVYGQIRLFKSIQDASKVPLFLALGNHDIQRYGYNPDKKALVGDQSVAAEARREWSRTFQCFRRGTYYEFRKKVGRVSYRFVVLDNGDAGKDTRFTNAQLKWFRERLAAGTRDPIIVVMHVPFIDRDFFTQLKAAIAGNPRVALALAGHRHVDAIEEIDLGGRVLVQVLSPALRAGDDKWRLIRLFEDRIQINAAGEAGKVVRTIRLGAAAPALAAGKGTLRAGAARVDITPPAGAALRLSGYANRTEGFKDIHDRLYVRAVVVDDGTTQAAIVTADLTFVRDNFWEAVSKRIASETGIPREHILLAATHTHAAPEPREGAFAADVERKFVQAVVEARAKLQPARMGAGTGRVNVNVNRRAPMAGGGLWLGRNPDGPTDKTLAVIKFESLAGEPLAIFMNYGVHATVQGPKNLNVSGDLAGAASLYVEQTVGKGVVANWSSGAAGDQAPIYNRAESYDDVFLQGKLIGEEAIRVAGTLRMSQTASIRGAQKVITCPGQKVTSGGRPDRGQKTTFGPGDPVPIRLSLLRINDVALAGVSAEVLTMIGQRLKKESPLANTVLVANCNGSSGYLPDDASYEQLSYEIVSSRVQKGCAEKGIVEGFLELLDRR